MLQCKIDNYGLFLQNMQIFTTTCGFISIIFQNLGFLRNFDDIFLQ